jgi:hypothetical protein
MSFLNTYQQQVIEYGGGGGGGGKSYQETVITLTGNTGFVEFDIPANTTQMILTINPFTCSTAFAANCKIQLGDDVGYYSSGYFRDTIDASSFLLTALQTGNVLFVEMSNGNTVYFFDSVYSGSIGQTRQGGVLQNITTNITKLKITNDGDVDLYGTTSVFKLSCLVIV